MQSLSVRFGSGLLVALSRRQPVQPRMRGACGLAEAPMIVAMPMFDEYMHCGHLSGLVVMIG